jgi:hypothetical protein
MLRSHVFILALLVSSKFSLAMAAEIRYECPKEIHTEQSAVKTKVPSGWEPKRDFSPKPQVLEGLSVYDGPPEEGARLVPDNEENANPAKSFWTFDKKKERSIWLGCEYTGSSIFLAKELAASVTTCRLLVSDTRSSPRFKGVTCK